MKVFGSPCTFSKRFAFGLKSEEEAERMWEKIEEDTDIVVTHTPAKGVMDECEEGKELGCPALMRKLAEVRPLMHVCGHVHEGRGVRRVRWRDEPIDVWESRLGENTQPDVLTMLVTNIDKPQAIEPDSLAASFIEAEEHWQDPGAGNKKLSLVDVTRKAGRALENTGCLTRHIVSDSLRKIVGGQSVSDEDCQPDSDKSKSTTSLEGSALVEDGAGMWRRTRGGAIESRIRSDVGCEVDQAVGERLRERQESVMINAAFVGPRGSANKPTSIGRKPIVVDIELPVWDLETVSNAA